MKFIYRNNSYSLERTAHCFVLSKITISKEKNLETVTTIGYYHKLPDAILELFNRHVLDKVDVVSILECIKTTKEELKNLFSIEVEDEILKVKNTTTT